MFVTLVNEDNMNTCYLATTTSTSNKFAQAFSGISIDKFTPVEVDKQGDCYNMKIVSFQGSVINDQLMQLLIVSLKQNLSNREMLERLLISMYNICSKKTTQVMTK